MPLYSEFGDVLVQDQELKDRYTADDYHKFFDPASTLNELDFSTGRVTSEKWKKARNIREPVPIGLYRPLTVFISQVYTGKTLGKKLVGPNKKDMLLTSALKGIGQISPTTRAINFLERDVEAKQSFEIGNGAGFGTPLVYYSPAQMESALALTIEFGFDSIKDGLINLLNNAGSLVVSGSQLPIFATASPYLFGVGSILKISAGLVNFLEDNAAFSETIRLNFDLPGPLAEAKFHLITSADFSEEEISGLRITENGKCVYRNGRSYQGDHPFVVISLDGDKRDQYRDFSGMVVSAALLEQYFGIQDGNQQSLEPLIEGLQLYNDLRWRKKADELERVLPTLEKGTLEYEKAHSEYGAFLENIRDERLRPSY